MYTLSVKIINIPEIIKNLLFQHIKYFFILKSNLNLKTTFKQHIKLIKFELFKNDSKELFIIILLYVTSLL